VDLDTRTEGAVLIGRYVLERRLGSGGAGVVWRADDRVLQRPVAVKLLHPELAHDPATGARFRTEAASAAKLTHPNAVIVYDIGRDGDRDFLVMELVDGPDLSELIAQGPLAPDTTAYLGAAIASALGLAHERGMLHRDVKPANVLLNAAGVPKVADFGIARALGEATARLTTPGSVMGTARYLAPEQLLDGPLDGRVDVYALGLVLHEALTGRAPWGTGTALEIASRRLSGDLPPPSRLRPDLPPGLDAVVQRATRREADDRYADGAAMAAALVPFIGDAGRQNLDRLLRSTPVIPDPPAPTVPVAPVRPGRGARSPAAPDRVGPDRAGPGRSATGRAAPGRTATASRPTAQPHVPPPTTPLGAAAPPRRRPAERQPRRAADRGASRPAATREPPRPRRPRRPRRRRGRRLLVMLLLVATVTFAGTRLEIPGTTELNEAVQRSEVGELLRDVRDGLPERFGG
jgi:eukaryotic-like serine/threonine-protein kinase